MHVKVYVDEPGTDVVLSVFVKAMTYADSTGGLLVGTTHMSGSTDKSIFESESGGKITVGMGITDKKGNAGKTGGT